MSGGMDIFDLFGFGGGSRRGRGQQQKRKTRDVPYELDVALSSLYHGKARKLRINRNTCCTACRGAGTASGRSPECGQCNGQGAILVSKRINATMMQQMQTTCPECRGTGQVVSPDDVCEACRGERLVAKQETVEVFIDPGMDDGHKIRVKGKADEHPGAEAGDLVVIIRTKRDPNYTRDGCHLTLNKKIGLSEALMGYKALVNHPGGHKILLDTKQRIVRPGQMLAILEEGMPVHKSPMSRGNLFVKFEVIFPASLSDKERAELAAVLPAPRPVPEFDETEVHTVEMIEYREEMKQQARRATSAAYDEDDQDQPRRGPSGGMPGGMPGGAVQCTTF